MLQQIRKFTLVLMALLAAAAVSADVLDGKKHIYLVDKKGNEIEVGTVTFQQVGDQSTYKLHMDHDRFKDFFLSMKEMKCLEGPELMCHLPYPYEQPHRVSASDLSWLSHDLLFMFKKPSEFGANFWNGIYFDMSIEGKQIKGIAQAVDLNLLASPPDDLSIPPVNEAERDEIDPKLRWLPYLLIR
jgi:hypothetical protein